MPEGVEEKLARVAWWRLRSMEQRVGHGRGLATPDEIGSVLTIISWC